MQNISNCFLFRQTIRSEVDTYWGPLGGIFPFTIYSVIFIGIILYKMDFRIVCHRFMKTKLDPIFDRRLNYYQPKQKGSNMRSIFPGIILFSIIGQMCRRWEKWCMWCSRNQPLNPKTQSPTFLGTMNSGVISDQLICLNN